MRGNGPRVRAGAGSLDPAGKKPKVEDTTWWGCAQSTASGAQEAPAGLGLGGLGQDVSEGRSQTPSQDNISAAHERLPRTAHLPPGHTCCCSNPPLTGPPLGLCTGCSLCLAYPLPSWFTQLQFTLQGPAQLSPPSPSGIRLLSLTFPYSFIYHGHPTTLLRLDSCCRPALGFHTQSRLR